jgi:hypothetical protein
MNVDGQRAEAEERGEQKYQNRPGQKTEDGIAAHHIARDDGRASVELGRPSRGGHA